MRGTLFLMRRHPAILRIGHTQTAKDVGLWNFPLLSAFQAIQSISYGPCYWTTSLSRFFRRQQYLDPFPLFFCQFIAFHVLSFTYLGLLRNFYFLTGPIISNVSKQNDKKFQWEIKKHIQSSRDHVQIWSLFSNLVHTFKICLSVVSNLHIHRESWKPAHLRKRRRLFFCLQDAPNYT